MGTCSLVFHFYFQLGVLHMYLYITDTQVCVLLRLDLVFLLKEFFFWEGGHLMQNGVYIHNHESPLHPSPQMGPSLPTPLPRIKKKNGYLLSCPYSQPGHFI